MASKVTAVVRMTTTKAAISLRKIPFLTALSLSQLLYFFHPLLLSRSLWGLEAVAGAADGFEIARVFGVRLDFFADAADIDVDRARGHVGRVTPDGIEKMVAGKDPAEVAGEVIEQAKLGGGGGDGLSANGEDHGGGVDGDFADLKRAGRERTLKAAEHGFDAGDEFARAERLGDVVVGSDLETEDAVGFAAFGGEENHRHGC